MISYISLYDLYGLNIYEVRYMKYDFKTTRRSPLEIEDSTIPKKTILKRVIGARGVLLDLGCTSCDLRHLGTKFNVESRRFGTTLEQ